MQKAVVLIIAMLFLLISRPASGGITNGDFSAGNSGFTSAYTYTSSSGSVGDYSVVANPQTFEAGLFSFGDHTTGSGLMMVVDGYLPTATVWSEAVAVTTQTNYSFTGWFRATYGGNTPQIAMNVASGPVSLGSLTPVSLTDTQWQQFAVNFNTGAASSVTLSFSDQNANYLAVGDDFAADDLALAPIVALPEPASAAIFAGATTLLMRRKRA